MSLAINQWAALEWLGRATQQTFDISRLQGPRNLHTRQTVLAALHERRVPAAKCGVNALRESLYKLANVPEDTLAGQERHFTDWAKQQILN